MPLETTRKVFDIAPKQLSVFLLTMPDGEVGEETSFVQLICNHLPAEVGKVMFGGTPVAKDRTEVAYSNPC